MDKISTNIFIFYQHTVDTYEHKIVLSLHKPKLYGKIENRRAESPVARSIYKYTETSPDSGVR